MSALALYSALPTAAQATLRARTLSLVGLSDPELSLFDATGGDDDHPALRNALREWWHSATTDEIVARIDAADERAKELAIVLCAEACGHLSTDPRVAECRRVRLAWARGEASDEQSAAASSAAWAAASDAAWSAASSVASSATSYVAWDAASSAASSAAWAAASSATSYVAWDAAWDATSYVAWDAIAAPLRALYPDPCEITVRCGLARWDVAVVEALSALRAIGETQKAPTEAGAEVTT